VARLNCPTPRYRLVSQSAMHRRVAHRILVFALVLTRLALGDFLHLPAAHAAGHQQGPSKTTVVMIAAEPCPAMGSMPADHAGHPVPGQDGTCCKSFQCPCLHAPALMMTLQMPIVSAIGFTEISATVMAVIGDPPAVFFRPPI
jgi:hypothetical protein